MWGVLKETGRFFWYILVVCRLTIRFNSYLFNAIIHPYEYYLSYFGKWESRESETESEK